MEKYAVLSIAIGRVWLIPRPLGEVPGAAVRPPPVAFTQTV